MDAPLADREILAGASSVENGRLGLERLLARTPDLDAVYFSNDDMALGGYFHCLARGISIPAELAIFGYNGLDIGRATPQPLSTIRTPRVATGQVAAQLVVDQCAGPGRRSRFRTDRRGNRLTPRGTAMSDARLREEICRYGRSLFERGLTPGSSGNISLRLEDGGWLVTPTNASLGFLDPARISRLDAEGRLLSGDKPTKEIPLHTALYDTRGSARAIVHLHSTHAVALTMLPEIDPRAALPPMTPYYLMRAGETALVPYYRPGDPAVADAIRGLAGKYSSVLLANHGPVVAGDSLEAAVFATEELEETAKLYLLLRNLNPRYLSPAQVADLAKTFGLDLPSHHDHDHD